MTAFLPMGSAKRKFESKKPQRGAVRWLDRLACMKFRKTVLLVLTAFAGIALIAHGQEAHPAAEQKLFSPGDSPIQHPVTLQPDVLRVLLATQTAKQTLSVLDDSQKTNPSQLFQAGEVHLSNPNQVDLVVIGVAPMKGADANWFWIVRSARKDPQVVLFGGGDSLEVLDNKTHGAKDIRIAWSSSFETEATTYQFDGAIYQVRKADNGKIN